MAELALQSKRKKGSKTADASLRSTEQRSLSNVGKNTDISQPPSLGTYYSAAPAMSLAMPVQAKVTIGKADDPYEREADTVAERVMSGEPVPSITSVPVGGLERGKSAQKMPVQRQDEEGAEESNVQSKFIQRQSEDSEEEVAQPKLVQRQGEEDTEEESNVQSKFIQRQSEDSEEDVQTKDGSSQSPSMASTAAHAINHRGPGEPLNSPVKNTLESSMGVDLSDVRVHQDTRAQESAQALKARAFTNQNHIWLGKSESQHDVGLMAHETTHVLQQTGSIHRKLIQREPAADDGTDGQEPTEAEKAAALAAAEVAEQAAAQTESKGKDEVKKSKTKEVAEKEAGKVAKEAVTLAKNAAEAKAGAEKPKQEAEPGAETEEKEKEKEGKKAGTTPSARKRKGSGKSAGKVATATDAKAPASAEEDPGFQAVIGNVKGVAGKQQAHDPSKSKADAAQQAAESPKSELEGKAQTNQVGEMEQAETPVFDAAAFKAQLMERIAALAPKTVEEADDFKKNDKLGGLKGDMQSKVAEEKNASQAPMAEKTAAAPDASSVEPKPVIPLNASDPGAEPAIMGAGAAAPKQKGRSELEAPLEENSAQADKKMAEAGVTDEQLKKSNEPEFHGALDSKTEAKTQAREGAQAYRGSEQEQLSQAEGDAATVAQDRTQAMHTGRAGLLTQVDAQQGQTKTKDEQARDKVAGDIKQIYEGTKTRVETLLNALDGKVTELFDAGAAAAKQAFEDYVESKMRAYKQRRYGGWLGWAKWAKDKLLGMPSEVNAFYRDGRKLYLDKMDAVIDNVVALIGTQLTEAKAEIAKGKKEIQDYVDTLPANLQKVGQEASEEIQEKFDELEQSVDNKQNELIDTLANKYQENLKAIDARIDELKAANQGLVDKAINAVVGVIKTILEIKNLLLKVLSKIANVVSDILSDPIGFLGNLISGLKQGFLNFSANIVKHMQTGLINWLTGALGPMGIQMPENLFSLKGIFSLVMQVLGLGWDFIRRKAVKLMGEPVVKFLETAFVPFKILITEGIGGLWNYVKEQFSNLKEMVLEQIKSMVITQVIKAGIKWLLGLLNPAAAFIKAAMTIYEIVKFLWERAKQILEFIEAVVDAVAAIAKGSIGNAAKMVENALAKALPLVIGFLASLLGIGGLAKKVQNFLKSLRKKFSKAIDKLLMKAKKVARKLFGKVVAKKAKASAIHLKPEERIRLAKREVHQFLFKGIDRKKLPNFLKRTKSKHGLVSLRVEDRPPNRVSIHGKINPEFVEMAEVIKDNPEARAQAEAEKDRTGEFTVFFRTMSLEELEAVRVGKKLQPEMRTPKVPKGMNFITTDEKYAKKLMGDPKHGKKYEYLVRIVVEPGTQMILEDPKTARIERPNRPTERAFSKVKPRIQTRGKGERGIVVLKIEPLLSGGGAMNYGLTAKTLEDDDPFQMFNARVISLKVIGRMV